MFCFKLTSHSCFPVTDKYLKLRKKINDVRNGAGENKSQRHSVSSLHLVLPVQCEERVWLCEFYRGLFCICFRIFLYTTGSENSCQLVRLPTNPLTTLTVCWKCQMSSTERYAHWQDWGGWVEGWCVWSVCVCDLCVIYVCVCDVCDLCMRVCVCVVCVCVLCVATGCQLQHEYSTRSVQCAWTQSQAPDHIFLNFSICTPPPENFALLLTYTYSKFLIHVSKHLAKDHVYMSVPLPGMIFHTISAILTHILHLSRPKKLISLNKTSDRDCLSLFFHHYLHILCWCVCGLSHWSIDAF